MIARLITAAIAATGVIGVIVVLWATNAGTAPGNGQQTFDAPGCGPEHYDGPSPIDRSVARRPCPLPKPIIILHSRHARDGWHVTLSGSHSFDPDGEKLVAFRWIASPGIERRGVRVTLLYPRPGWHKIILYVTDGSGSTGSASYTVNLR